ncbi:MAG: nickel-dependent hydrogenase large subunit [bacterium]
MKKLKIDPVTRIEGHLQIELSIEDGIIKEARAGGPMFRGIEIILKGRHPLDATRITQRICGVCPTSHSMASARCLDDALGMTGKIPPNGELIRNLLLGCNFIQSHVLHFYHLAAMDYVRLHNGVEAGLLKEGWGPFFPQHEADYKPGKEETLRLLHDYIKALDIRRQAHEMQAIFGGKMPHQVGIIAGGVTMKPTADKIADFRFRLLRIKDFIENSYIPDVLTVAGCYPEYWKTGASAGHFLAYGALDGLFAGGAVKEGKLEKLNTGEITESVKHSRFKDGETLHPSQGKTEPQPEKDGAYSWVKAPRYGGYSCEVGPLARLMVNYLSRNPAVIDDIEKFLKVSGAPPENLNSVLGRHAARALEALLVAKKMEEWILKLEPGGEAAAHFEIPAEGEGAGLTEAPRGALGHWIKIRNGVIGNYQCVVPTTWNASPRDDKEQPGPIETALEGCPVKDTDNPVEPLRVVRSFDPCLACAVHVLNRKGNGKDFSVL